MTRQSVLALAAAIASIPAFAAVTGTVMNGTTGNPQPNVIIAVVEPGAGGMQTLDTVKSDDQGRFKSEKTPRGMSLLQAIYKKVMYTAMVPPNAAAGGVQVVVFDTTDKRDGIEVEQHALFIEPREQQIRVAENYILNNTGRATYDDPANGTVRFYLPPAAQDKPAITIIGLERIPIQRTASPAGPKNVFKIDYPVKPGETLFTIQYTLPVSAAEKFSGKILDQGDALLIVPKGVTLTGAEPKGEEPRFQGTKYAVKPGDFEVALTGTGEFREAAQQPQQPSGEDTGQPRTMQANPHIYEKLPLVLGLSIAILGLGFIVLYRGRVASKPPAPKGKLRG